MLYLQHGFYNINFKIKKIVYSLRAPPPPKEKFWMRAWIFGPLLFVTPFPCYRRRNLASFTYVERASFGSGKDRPFRTFLRPTRTYLTGRTTWGQAGQSERVIYLHGLSSTCQYIWDLWWTNSQWDRLSFRYFSFPLSASFYQRSISVFYHPTKTLRNFCNDSVVHFNTSLLLSPTTTTTTIYYLILSYRKPSHQSRPTFGVVSKNSHFHVFLHPSGSSRANKSATHEIIFSEIYIEEFYWNM
jgi:hypothetical protein